MSEVRVKPLDWEEYVRSPFQFISDEYLLAADALGRHWVHHRIKGDLRGDDGKVQFYRTTDEAKAAAQADFEARIRSAILPDVSGREEDGWRPIETAPKDGKAVQIFDSFSDDRTVDGFGIVTASFKKGIGWRIVVRGDVLVVATNPRCWRPLPAPPALQTEGK